MTQGSAHPPKARLVLRVGITGHRPNKLGSDTKAVRAKVRAVLTAIKEILDSAGAEARALGCYRPEPPLLRIISALAEGADRIAAEEAMELGAELQVVLPFAKEEYERDFETDASKEEFRALMARANGAVMTLDGRGVRPATKDETAKQKAAEDRAYRAAGLMMLRQSDVVIAVWDGEKPVSSAGTGAIAKDALKLGLPVVWIDSRDPDAVPALLTEIDHSTGDNKHGTHQLPHLSDLLRALLLPSDEEGENKAKNVGHRPLPWHAYFDERRPRWNVLGWVYGQFVSLFSCQWRKFLLNFFLPLFQILFPRLRFFRRKRRSAANEKHEDFAYGDLAAHYVWADQLADKYGAAHRGGYVLGFSLAPVAVFFAVLFLVSNWTAGFDALWAVLELLTILLILVLVWAAKDRRWHARWLEYRFLAEQLRQMRMLAPLGRAPGSMRAPAHHAFATPGASFASWYFRAAVREAGLASESLDAERRQHLKAEVVLPLICGQEAYHRLVKRRHARVAEALHMTHLALFGLTFIVVALHVGHEWHHLMEWSFPEPGSFQPKPLNMLAAVLPAFGASFAARATQGEFHRLAERSEAMAQRLKGIARELEALSKPSATQLGDLAEEAADLMLAEVLDWRVMFLARPPELPA